MRFHDLMGHRVQRILLVASLYDSFILAEDGQLHRAILSEYLDLNLSSYPDLTWVSSGADALEAAAGNRPVDLVITSLHVGDMDALTLARSLRDAGVETPVVLLAYDNRALTEFKNRHDVAVLDRLFLWQGDVRILLAIVKDVEDRRNVAHDTGVAGVPAIIVVEDNVRFYSSFLPVIYTELVRHTQGLIAEGMNLSQKMMRMRARPKVLLCETYESAWDYFVTYEGHIMGVISDIEFPRHGVLDRRAGLDFARDIRRRRFDIPLMLQSSFPENEALAQSLGAAFLLKGSPVLLEQLRRHIVEALGFGDFVFKMPDGSIIDRAVDLQQLVDKLTTVPAESLAYHGEQNHFSNWLKARGEFALADKLRPRRVKDFATLDDLRQDLVQSIVDYRHERDRIIVADFDRNRYDPDVRISRIGGGSLGGKARGMAFVNRLLSEYHVYDAFPDIHIAVPTSVVLGTDIFDEFLDLNHLRDFAIRADDDGELERRFLGAPFPREALIDLAVFLEHTRVPLAVRSSGLLEDSPNQAFAGIYQTYMLPNDERGMRSRVEQLVAAVKRVYASTFSQRTKAFMKMTAYRLEEEKMAVMIQRVVGRRYGDRFYPHLSGVARSHNFYPLSPLRSEDGIVAIALGLGKTVVDGEACFRFCPRYPKHMVAFPSVESFLRDSQRHFYALDLSLEASDAGLELGRYSLGAAERDGTLGPLGSTWDPANDTIYDGTSRVGTRLVSFAPLLKHGVFPIAEILDAILQIGCQGTSSEVEIEFAVNLPEGPDARPEFAFLQMRPMALSAESEELLIGPVDDDRILCRSSTVLGNGRTGNICDVISVGYHDFDRTKSRATAAEVGRLNAQLVAEGRPYLLIGVGRWGSADPFLGVPVTWDQICGARVIVEAGLKDLRVDPSQGTHFFQNLSSCNVGFFTVNPELGDGSLDWAWLASQPAMSIGGAVRHIRLPSPMLITINGQRGEGLILKPDPSPDTDMHGIPRI